MKKYQLLPGIILSVLLTLVLSLRRLIRIGDQPAVGFFSFAALTFLYLTLSWAVLQVVHQTGSTGRESLKRQWLRGITGVIMAVILSYAHETLYSIIAPDSYMAEDLVLARRRLLFLPGIRGLVIGSFQYFVIYYFAMTQHVQRAKMEIEQLKKENLEARLSLLKQQVSPHFLFNSLNTLKTMTDAPDARQYIVQLSHVYRYLLSYNDNSMATLKDEMEFTESYLAILKERYENALLINKEIPEAALHHKLPPLALQILIENAIKHNIVSVEEPLTIDIRWKDDMLEVANNLNRRLSVAEQTGTGLHNIRERYRLLCQRSMETDINHDSFVVRIPLIPA